MKSKCLNIHVPEKFDINEVKKIIGYASEDIINLELGTNNSIILYVNSNANVENIQSSVNLLLSNYIASNNGECEVFMNAAPERKYYSPEEIQKTGNVIMVGNGSIGFKEEALVLYDYFEKVFLKIALDVGCTKRKYPVLLPLKTYQKSGYLKKSPQYAIFCCDLEEDINRIKDIDIEDNIECFLNPPNFALSPSACFHVYHELQNLEIQESISITLTQDVFRNEGRFNWNEYGRLRCYTIRELVFIGDNCFVEQKIKEVQQRIQCFLSEINLNSRIVTSSDAFIMPEFQKMKRIQQATKSKYEVRIKVNEEHELACASLNLHGITFSKAFNFKVAKTKVTVSACVGFGIERWVLAFLSQYGTNRKLWPQTVINGIQKMNL